MAEDLHNPLNNPGADPVGQAPTPREEPPEANDELSEFLDDIFESEPRTISPEEPPNPADSVSSPAAEERVPESQDSPHPAEAEASPPSASDAHGESSESAGEPSQDELQRQVLQNLNAQLERMGQPPEQPQQQAEPITPDVFLDHYRPKIEQYVKSGWLDEDQAVLYPMDAAMKIHLYEMGGQLQQGVQQTQRFTQEEETRRSQESASQQLNSAIDEVAARGDVFGALGTDDVRNGFREFLINDVNPTLSQVTPDFLARQFYAYNHQLILDTVRQGQQSESAETGETSAADLAQQEGSSSRGAAPTSQQKPEFTDLLEGTAAARWYE